MKQFGEGWYGSEFMTILAAWADGVDRAVIYADSEVYRAHEGAPFQHRPKLAVNALACAVGAGTGMSVILRGADEAMADAATFDDIPDLVARALRREVSRCAGLFDKDPSAGAPSYVTVGWSGSANRFLAYTYEIWNFFSPMLCATHWAPAIERSVCWRPISERELLTAAREQVEVIRHSMPGTGAGTLTVAELRPGFIAVRAIPGFSLPDPDDRPQVPREAAPAEAEPERITADVE